jgi:hypothetical protein
VLDDRAAEIGQVVGLAAGDELAVADHRSVDPDGAGALLALLKCIRFGPETSHFFGANRRIGRRRGFA